jgi:predicted permease
MTQNSRDKGVAFWIGLESAAWDVRYAIRRAFHSPAFAVTVIVTLALAVGVNTAVFSVVNALLIEKLPYERPERIATLYLDTQTAPPTRRSIDGEQWELLRDDVPSLESAVSTFNASVGNLQAGAYAQQVREGRVSAHYLDVLGIAPFVGRNFSVEEDRPGGGNVAILSYSLWRSAFGSNPSLLGSTVQLKGESYTVIGVLPEGAVTPLAADVYTPLRPSRDGEGQAANYSSLVRLQDGVTWQRAEGELNRALARSSRTQRLASESQNQQIRYVLVSLQTAQTERLRPQVLALMLATALILLIACANLAGLTLVRVLRGEGEMAVRLALGGSKWRIQRQLWIEHLLLALVGGSAAIGVGALSLTVLLKLLPPEFLPIANVPLDGHVLAFALGVSIFTSLLFGALPTLTLRKLDPRSFTTGSRSTVGRRRARWRQGLIAGEVALAVVLLAAAGLLIRSLIYLQTLPPGFTAEGVVTAKASLNDTRYSDSGRFRTLLDESLEALRQIPGVEDAAVVSTPPYERPLINGVRIADGPRAGQVVSTNWMYVTPSYFSTLEIPLISGRVFSEGDGPKTQSVVIVNRTFARKFFGDINPIGRSLGQFNGPPLLVVGVVGDTLLSSAGQLNEGSAPLVSEEAMYVPAAQVVDAGFLSQLHTYLQPSWIVRAASTASLAEMQRALGTVDPSLTFSGIYSMEDLMGGTLALQRVEVTLLSVMAGLALALSAVGLCALVMNIVAERTRELGIRMALGSTLDRIVLRVVGSTVAASLLGGGVGLGVSIGILRAIQNVLYGVTFYDATTLSIVLACLGAVTIAATVMPAMRVGRIETAKVLREE